MTRAAKGAFKKNLDEGIIVRNRATILLQNQEIERERDRRKLALASSARTLAEITVVISIITCVT